MAFYPLKIKEVRRETADCSSFVLEVPDAYREQFLFRQGQHLNLRAFIDGEEIRRSYSICAGPHERELRIAIKKQEQGRFSTYAHLHFKAGAEVEVMPPAGRFFTEVNPGQVKRYLAFAAGSGITPVISILKTILYTEPQSECCLVYGNRNHESIIFREELGKLKNRYMDRFSVFHVFSRERTEIPAFNGHIDGDKCRWLLRHVLPAFHAAECFICGPEGMTAAVKTALAEAGVDPRHIHYELFTTAGAAALQRPAAQPGQEHGGKQSLVTIRLNGSHFELSVPYDGIRILDAALQTGADLPYACKGGVCCTCRARVLEGAVEMETNYGLEQEELEAGFVLACQSHPRSERVTLDFDVR